MKSAKKTAFVTGASSGMGKEIAKKLLADGLTVYAAARRVEKMKDLKELGIHVIRMDITKEEDVVNAVTTVEKNHGGIDVLVNNAGFGSYGTVEDTSIDDARYQFEVNLFGLARLTRLALPYMREQKSGTIINMSSMGGKIYTPLGAWYHATKHALEGWSDCLRLELKQFNINVVIIEPGLIETEFGGVVIDGLKKRSEGSAYGELSEKLIRATESSYERGGSSPPSVIASLVSKAVKARKPKTRYAGGSMAKPLLFIRRYFSDRFFDMAVMSQVK